MFETKIFNLLKCFLLKYTKTDHLNFLRIITYNFKSLSFTKLYKFLKKKAPK